LLDLESIWFLFLVAVTASIMNQASDPPIERRGRGGGGDSARRRPEGGDAGGAAASRTTGGINLPDDSDAEEADAEDEETEEESKARFERELEFVQCLASPAYLHFLATYRDDDDEIDDVNEAKDHGGDSEDDSSSSEDETASNDAKVGSKRERADGSAAPLSRKRRGPRRGGGGSSSTGSVGVLHDPRFRTYLVYLRDTWSRPEYAVYLSYPHCLYFLNLLIDHPDLVAKEWALPAYRNFCHQQQFLAWQHRFSTLYGVGGGRESTTTTSTTTTAASGGEPATADTLARPQRP
jgi:hypothetical protein